MTSSAKLSADLAPSTAIGFLEVGSGDRVSTKSGHGSRGLGRGQHMTIWGCKVQPDGTVRLSLRDDACEEYVFTAPARGALKAEFIELTNPSGTSTVVFRRISVPTRPAEWLPEQ